MLVSKEFYKQLDEFFLYILWNHLWPLMTGKYGGFDLTQEVYVTRFVNCILNKPSITDCLRC
jgi:hypothetical protein